MQWLASQLLQDKPQLRRCSNCGSYKPESNYTIKNKAKRYLDTRCNTCKSKLVMSQKDKIPLDPSTLLPLDRDILYFMETFKGIPSGKVARSLNTFTSKHKNWSKSKKSDMAYSWASRNINSRHNYFKEINLFLVREKALTY